MQNRRDFLKTLPLVPGTLMLAVLPQKESYGASLLQKEAGIQLWTLRNEMQNNVDETLKAVSALGYKSIETYGFDGGFYGREAVEFSRFCNALGLTIHSSHSGISDSTAAAWSGKAAEAGLSFLILPSMMGRPEKSLDDFRRTADEMNRIGEACLKNGIRFGYHNHDFEFREMEGKLPYEILLQNTDPKLVSFQMDIYWVIKGGQDPYMYFDKYPGRFTTWHMKDLATDGKSCIVGNGRIDFRNLLEKAGQAGLERVFVEQEHYDEGAPLHCAGKSLNYIKKHLF